MGVRIYVGNLPYATDSSALEEMFKAYGAVVSAEVIFDRASGRSKGFGFVEMAERAEAEAAISALAGASPGGRPLTVNEAKPREERPARGFGGGGGGRFGARGDRG
jgi:RNA recognition motif-containing protein